MSFAAMIGRRRQLVVPTPPEEPEAPVSPDWEILRDFNAGETETAANGTADGFDGEASASVYTTERVYAGARACKLTITEGQGGFGAWGGRVNFSGTLSKGDTLWYQHWYYMPEAFILSTSTGWLKYLRFLTQNDAAENVGYNDLYINDDESGEPSTTYRWILEGQGQWLEYGPSRRFLRDQWVRQSLRIDLSDVPVAAGGSGRVRHWENGTLLLDSATQQCVDGSWLKTLNTATDRCVYHLLHTYWNNDNAPATQSSYVDDIRIAKNGVPSWALDLPEAA